MKKNCLTVLCVALLFTCMSVSVMACDVTEQVRAEECVEDFASARADILYYVHQYFGELKMHRLWNETKGEWVGPWTVCNCK